MTRCGRLSVALLFLLSACGGGGAAIDAGRGDGGALDAASDAGLDGALAPGDLSADYCAPLAMQLCASASTCGCGALLPGGTLDAAACVRRWTARCLDAWQPFVDAGAQVDGAAATQCLATIQAATPTCAAPSSVAQFALCEPFVVEPVALGAACHSPYCAGGQGVCSGGTCAMRHAESEPCEGMFDCETGLLCAAGQCVVPGAGGAVCASDLDCMPPLQCNGSPGTCMPIHASGVACTMTSECGVGLVCDAGHCAAGPTTCASDDACGHRARCGGTRACTARATVGGACTEDRDCEATLLCDASTCVARPGVGEACARGTVCALGLGCDGDGGHCQALPTSGQPCAFGEMGGTCADGLGCVGDFTCGPLPAVGEACAAGNACAAGLGCDFTATGSFCIVPRGAGGACQSDRSCASAFHCGPEGTCVADRAAGEPCSVGNECAGVCGPDASGGLSCRPAPGVGDPCLFSDDCPTSLTCGVSSRVCASEICQTL